MTSALFTHCCNGNSHSLPFHSAGKTNYNDTQNHRHIANSLLDQNLCSCVQCMATFSFLLHFAQLGDHLYPRHRYGLPLGHLTHGTGPKDVCVKVQLALCGDTAAKIAVGPLLTPVLHGLCVVRDSLSGKGARVLNAMDTHLPSKNVVGQSFLAMQADAVVATVAERNSSAAHGQQKNIHLAMTDCGQMFEEAGKERHAGPLGPVKPHCL